MEFSNRANAIEEGIFSILNQKKNELIAAGRSFYNLSVGTPDFKPQPHVMEALMEAAKDTENYKYALCDKPELLEAVKSFYKSRFGVEIETDCITSMNGSQEGMSHIALALCNEGDVVLAPNPGYPIFSIGPELCGAKIVPYPLYEKHNFLPDFADIKEEDAKKAKYMVVSYPANPVCSVANDEFYKELILFAKKYDIMILHDNAYPDIVFGGREGKSFLSYEGASEVGIEFYSLSKSYNMTGMRVSFALGNKEMIKQFRKVRSQIDFGIFLPIQYAAIAALLGPQEAVQDQCKEYGERNKALCGGLREIGWDVPDSQGTMFVWAPIPKNYTDCELFAMDLIEKAGVIVVPGTAFGSLGQGYIRMALVYEVPKMKEIVAEIKKSGILG